MRPTFKKLEVKDIGDLERLVAENVEGIEAGLRVIDSRLLLGQAAIDLVGLDAKGALVLIALDFTADESLLLRVMDAYSWCLEYPETIRRLYPTARVSPERPPRILFIVERLTESFMRRIKALSFLEIDCLEFRHLEVNGTSALYFDLVQRLRKSAAAEVATAEGGAAQTPGPMLTAPPQATPAPAPPPAVQPPPAPPAPQAAAPPPPSPEPPTPTAAVAPMAGDPRGLEPGAVEPESGPRDAATQVAVAELPELETELPLEAHLVERSMVPAPSTEAPVTGAAASLQQHLAEMVAATGPAEPVLAPQDARAPEDPPLRLESADDAVRKVMDRARANPEWHALLNSLRLDLPVPAPSAPAAAAPSEPEPVAAVEASVAPAPEAPAEPVTETAPEPAPVTEVTEVAAAEAAPPPLSAEPATPALETAPTPPVWAKPTDKPMPAPAGGRTYFFAQAAKSGGSAEREPAPPAPGAAASAAPPASPAPEGRPEFEALEFPKDGLSRQWLEFLNQLGAAK